MDRELYNQTLNAVCAIPRYSNYFDLFRELNFDGDHLVYGKYLHVQPPFPGNVMGPTECSTYEAAKNLFSMKYNELYNVKYLIDPQASDDDDDESD